MFNNIQYRFSDFCKTFRKNGIVALYHSLFSEVVFIPKAEFGKIQNCFEKEKRPAQKIEEILGGDSERLLNFLIKNSFLVQYDFSELEQLETIRSSIVSERTLEIMYILLTDGCNLRCRYCFLESPEKTEDFRPTIMDKKTALLAVETFSRLTNLYGRKGYDRFIHLYGGEPLINFDVLKTVTEYVGEMKHDGLLPANTRLILITNGTLIKKETARFLAKHRVDVGVSLDGPAYITDLYRTDVLNKGVFSKIVEGITILRDEGVKVGISCTLSLESLEHFDELLDYLVNDIGVSDGFSFNTLHFTPNVPVGEEYFERVADCFIKAFQLFREKGIYEERIMRRVRSYINKTLIFSDCGATGGQIVVAPDGKIGICQDFVKPRKYFFGSVFDKKFNPYESEIFREWQRRSPLFIDGCMSCPAISMCGGGCAASAELQFGSKWEIDTRICPINKKILEWIIWDQYSQIS